MIWFLSAGILGLPCPNVEFINSCKVILLLRLLLNNGFMYGCVVFLNGLLGRVRLAEGNLLVEKIKGCVVFTFVLKSTVLFLSIFLFKPTVLLLSRESKVLMSLLRRLIFRLIRLILVSIKLLVDAIGILLRVRLVIRCSISLASCKCINSLIELLIYCIL